MPDVFKGTVHRKNQMGDYKLAQEEQLSTFMFQLSKNLSLFIWRIRCINKRPKSGKIEHVLVKSGKKNF